MRAWPARVPCQCPAGVLCMAQELAQDGPTACMRSSFCCLHAQWLCLSKKGTHATTMIIDAHPRTGKQCDNLCNDVNSTLMISQASLPQRRRFVRKPRTSCLRTPFDHGVIVSVPCVTGTRLLGAASSSSSTQPDTQHSNQHIACCAQHTRPPPPSRRFLKGIGCCRSFAGMTSFKTSKSVGALCPRLELQGARDADAPGTSGRGEQLVFAAGRSSRRWMVRTPCHGSRSGPLAPAHAAFSSLTVAAAASAAAGRQRAGSQSAKDSGAGKAGAGGSNAEDAIERLPVVTKKGARPCSLLTRAAQPAQSGTIAIVAA